MRFVEAGVSEFGEKDGDGIKLRAEFGAMLPQDIYFAASHYPDSAVFEYGMESSHLGSASEARQREFIAGRRCAREALQRAGFASSALLPDPAGVPIWPVGSLASISHSRGLCAAVAAHRADYQALGLDLEKTNRLSPSAMRRTVHPLEADYVREDRGRATLIFSAKEAFYKAQFPRWKTHANFHDLALRVDEATGHLSIHAVDKPFPSELVLLAPRVEFRFAFVEDYVVTACWFPAG